jgi:hypothetical protein
MIQKKRTWLTAIAIAAGVAAIAHQGQRVKAQTGAQGGEAFMAAPITIVAANLPVVTGGGAPGPVRVREEQSVIPEARLEAAKAAAAAGAGPKLAATLGLSPRMPSALTPDAVVSFDGDFEGEAGCGNWIPSDHALAVGDGNNPIVQVVNECLSVWNTAGARLLGPVSLGSFFGLGAGANICDPRALFDWYNHRFIVSAIVCSAPYSASVAVSQSDNPLGAWFVYNGFGSLGSPGALMDYQRLGQDSTVTYPGTNFPGAIYVAYNLFNPGYVFEEWKVLPKGAMYAGQNISYWNFWGMSSGGVVTDSSQPANTWSPYEHPRAEFVVTSQNNGTGAQNAITVWAISNPFNWVLGGDSPELTGIVIGAANAWAPPPNAPQSGGLNNIETLDNRFTGEATYAHGHVHVAHSTANGAGGTASEIYKIQPFLNVSDGRCANALDVGLCPQIVGASIRNETVLNYGGTTAAWFAVPQPDLDGNVTTVFNFSCSTCFAGVAYISQRVTQPLGSFIDNGIYLANGLGVYTKGRWGDYEAVAPAGVAYTPGDGGNTGHSSALFAGQYADTSAVNGWRTRVGAVIFSNAGQATPTSTGTK